MKAMAEGRAAGPSYVMETLAIPHQKQSAGRRVHSETAADDTPEDMERQPAERTQTSPSNRDVYFHNI